MKQQIIKCVLSVSLQTKKPVMSHQYSKMVILYEENAPFPPEPDAVGLPKHEAEV